MWALFRLISTGPDLPYFYLYSPFQVLLRVHSHSRQCWNIGTTGILKTGSPVNFTLPTLLHVYLTAFGMTSVYALLKTTVPHVIGNVVLLMS